MPLRTRIKRAFTFGSQDEDNLSKTSSKSSKRVDPNVYQPGEKMPPLKYRRPVNPEHKAKLESFSWQKAWRRRSEQSLYSPMGSRMPSRKNSKSTLGRRSFQSRRSARSISERKSLRGNDGIGVDSGFGGSIDGDLDPRRLARHKEDSDDEGDVLNVGLSRNPTQDPRNDPLYRKTTSDRRSSSLHRRSESLTNGRSNSLHGSARASSRPGTSSDRARRSVNQPFAPEELELALKRSHLEAPKEESPENSAHATPGRLGRAPRSRQREQFAVDDASPGSPLSPGTEVVPQQREREQLIAPEIEIITPGSPSRANTPAQVESQQLVAPRQAENLPPWAPGGQSKAKRRQREQLLA